MRRRYPWNDLLEIVTHYTVHCSDTKNKMESLYQASGQNMSTVVAAARSAKAIYVHIAVFYLFCVYIYSVCIRL